MRTTINIDEDLLAQARRVTGVNEQRRSYMQDWKP